MSTSLARARLRFLRGFASRPALLFAFAFAVMADPVSSVAYAIEAAVRALHGDLGLLLPTMALVVAVIALIIVNYHQLVARFPEGGGAAAAAGRAFGEGWAFIPIGALIVDFVLTIAISAAAGASALIEFVPSLASGRVELTVALLASVAAMTWFGHIGRMVFGLMTVGFVFAGTAVLIGASHAHPARVGAITHSSGHAAFVAVLLSFPVAMALATGVEAPSSAIAQLGQLDDAGRRRFGRATLWLTLGIVGVLTIGLTAAAVRLGIGIPGVDHTQIGNLARVTSGHGVYVFFQVTTALLLLAAASSSFQAGPGLLKALSRRASSRGLGVGILPSWMGRSNDHHTPYWGVVLFLIVSALVAIASGANEQVLVLYYAVSVFLSFLIALLAMVRFSHQERLRGSLVMNGVGALVVAFTLVVDLARGRPVVAVAASLLIAAVLYAQWVRTGRPRGIAGVLSEAEASDRGPVRGTRTAGSRPRTLR